MHLLQLRDRVIDACTRHLVRRNVVRKRLYILLRDWRVLQRRGETVELGTVKSVSAWMLLRGRNVDRSSSVMTGEQTFSIVMNNFYQVGFLNNDGDKSGTKKYVLQRGGNEGGH